MNSTDRNYRKLHTYYPGMHAAEAQTSINGEVKEEKMRNTNIKPYSISNKCICYIGGFKRVLELVELIKRNERTKDGKLPVITKGILKDIIRYVEFINNIIEEKPSEVTEILSSLIEKTELSTADLDMLSSIANKNIIILGKIREKQKEGKEGRLK